MGLWDSVPGICKSGMGCAWNSRRVIFAIRLAHSVALSRRALSVMRPVSAYIWRYSFEMKTNAKRARNVGVQADLLQIARKL